MHVLVAEDDPIIREALAGMFALEGYRVTAACDGGEALSVFEQDPCDVLVTDLRMPVLDGHALIRSTRRQRPDMPVVVVTGNLPKNAAELLDGDARRKTAILFKPVAFEAIVSTVKAFMAPAT
ncbi:response regulator [Azospirillum soli]|uniref:response regulator n=1 Tax=Azospirillum soli TaxID=1304799 RepID=UPI001AE377A5|nr:response regulator [Azospirillum soli]MBP2314644.1 CheY-like chemotaxis protein [Azospirillum soli]